MKKCECTCLNCGMEFIGTFKDDLLKEKIECPKCGKTKIKYHWIDKDSCGDDVE